jgi:hypothetical protein
MPYGSHSRSDVMNSPAVHFSRKDTPYDSSGNVAND